MAFPVATLIPAVVEAVKSILKKKSPEVAEAVEKAFSDPETRLELEKLALKRLELEQLPEKWELEDRASAREMAKYDMTSDSWLSKNVRPLVLIYLTVMFTVAFFISVFSTKNFSTSPAGMELVETFQYLLLWVYGFYFGGRSLEKIVKIMKGSPSRQALRP
jgi:hypothetical protein